MNKEITIRIAKIYYDKLKTDQYRFGFDSLQSLCNEIFYNTDLENLKYRDFDFNYEHRFKFKLNKKPYEKYNNFELLYPLELRNKFKSIFSEAFENHK